MRLQEVAGGFSLVGLQIRAISCRVYVLAPGEITTREIAGVLDPLLAVPVPRNGGSQNR